MGVRILSGLVLLLSLGGCAGSAPARNLLPHSQSISKRLHAQSAAFEACRLTYGAEINGRLIVQFNVHANGRTTKAHVFEDIGQSSALDHCLTTAASSLRFDPLPKGLMAEVRFPIEFGSAAFPATSTMRPLQTSSKRLRTPASALPVPQPRNLSGSAPSPGP